jgi:hypothetical protein
MSTYSNVRALPVAPPNHRWVALVNLNGAELARAGFPTADRDAGAPWEWIVETVAQELGAHPETIGCEEGPEGEDYVTVDGLPVYEVHILRNFC